MEDELGLVLQLDLQLSDLSLKLKGVLGNAVLVVGLQAFQTDLKTDRRRLITFKYRFLLIFWGCLSWQIDETELNSEKRFIDFTQADKNIRVPASD